MMIECWCGAKPLPTPGLGGGNSVLCQCGLRYTVSVDLDAVYRRTNALHIELKNLKASLVKIGT